MSTIYTLNGKVLKNSATDKWLIKAVPPPPPEEVTIGTQTWKIKNLAIDDGQGGIYTHTVNYGQGDVVEYYYTFAAANRVAATVQGWHLPSASEWNTLASAVGGSTTAGTKLKSTYGWNDNGNGTDDYYFSGFPAGYLMNNGTFLAQFGNYAYFWTSTASSESYATTRTLNKAMDKLGSSNENKTFCYSVRLIKDA